MAPTSGNISAQPYSSTAIPPMWFAILPGLVRKRGRAASGRRDIGQLLLQRRKAEHGPLLVPAKRQT
jgi:hypothetical protein